MLNIDNLNYISTPKQNYLTNFFSRNPSIIPQSSSNLGYNFSNTQNTMIKSSRVALNITKSNEQNHKYENHMLENNKIHRNFINRKSTILYNSSNLSIQQYLFPDKTIYTLLPNTNNIHFINTKTKKYFHFHNANLLISFEIENPIIATQGLVKYQSIYDTFDITSAYSIYLIPLSIEQIIIYGKQLYLADHKPNYFSIDKSLIKNNSFKIESSNPFNYNNIKLLPLTYMGQRL